TRPDSTSTSIVLPDGPSGPEYARRSTRAQYAIVWRFRSPHHSRAQRRKFPVPIESNTKQIAHIDCAGGGQVWVDGSTLYVGHMRNPSGTSIYDIADPKSPKQLAHVPIPEGWHSHKVRVQNGIMIVNHERLGPGGPADFTGGL